ncbi:rod shape-determining protein MreC [Paucidesulfovibrio gracilis DSM 16080]|uniref:Cell shape-determining protein MreC n=1 Tax=Paucidesulfovibrio gracilis DSM 16080 TaxID=1121449 RepID=A0A1T4XJ18_9BACT|nr:rod shape-determining protein MreC [Paucidesulfovibrio gracilis]SKA89540.1 rod shape-determining protein MreC [Paucidesulfovibrio gracilis DSM 16080]
MRPRRLAVIALAGLFLYLALYTWNLRTGHLDALTSVTGLEVTGWALQPGRWIADKTSDAWHQYAFLVGVERENERLRQELDRIALENVALREQAAATRRLERLLRFHPPKGWTTEGVRVVAQRMGPAAALESILVDKGMFSGVADDMPLVTTRGVVGRVMESGVSISQVLLLTDVNSAVAVVGQEHRTKGVAFGRGPGKELAIRYMNINAELQPGELLVTSGMDGIFPKGLPVAVITRVDRSELSLFLDVSARPLVDVRELEEALLMRPAVKATGGH